MLKVKDLRESFLDFFQERGHRIVPSSPLIPRDDPTLLFTTAGMVQFKPMFAGTVELEYTRAATVQKCLRTSDLENVGRTKRHLTLFEMLGNFSFGDYFKQEAIEYSWDYSTNVIGFPAEKIWVSIYNDDDEAAEIWRDRIGVPRDRIVRLGREDNFWGPAGDSGACGPCSELYLDRGPEYGCGSDNCRPGCDCERFMEYWNLVFNQFNQDINGNLTPLPRTGIDTGMGLERLATLVQGVDSVYDTDEMKQLINFVCKSTGVSYRDETIVPVNIIVEHARSLVFAMADGIYPSNEGRGYVLRRILRRGLRYSRQIGVLEPFFYRLVDPITEIMADYYPELTDSAKNVKKVIESEEKRFLETLENGMDRLEEIIKGTSAKDNGVISGRDAFVLYDTFGFPVEMTVEIASENGLRVDGPGFEREMEKQRERGKQSWKGVDNGIDRAFEQIAREAGDTIFTGYDENVSEAGVILMHSGQDFTDRLETGESGLLVLDRTPFYGESGGQAGDRGRIVSGSGAVFTVSDTRKINRTVIHIGEVSAGVFLRNDPVSAEIDVMNRNLTRANHTVTHLLQAALRKVLGDHVKQAGSLVASDRMRFDFSHYGQLTGDEIAEIEDIVNSRIWENIPVKTEIMNIDDAIKSGALAVFDEKYEETVRVVSVDDYSRELCGGTHVSNTGQIGVFKILKESSPGAGLRRIEAATLRGILERYNQHSRVIEELSELVNVTESGILKKVQDVLDRNSTMEKEIEKLKREQLSSGVDDLLANAVDISGVKIVSHRFDGADTSELRDLSDRVRSLESGSLVLFGSATEGKALLLFAATGDAVRQGVDCGALIKKASPLVGGGGGGRKDMAQAGGKDPAGIEEALKAALDAASDMIS